MLKLSIPVYQAWKWNTPLKACIGNGTFELRDGTAKSSTMAKR
jgi:hypothetical protein